MKKTRMSFAEKMAHNDETREGLFTHGRCERRGKKTKLCGGKLTPMMFSGYDNKLYECIWCPRCGKFHGNREYVSGPNNYFTQRSGS